MRRLFHSPWLVALAVLILAVLPVIAAVVSYRDQARRGQELLLERSADVVTSQLRLATARQINWQSSLRFRLSRTNEPPERQLDELMHQQGESVQLPDSCDTLIYAAMEDERLVVRWRVARPGATAPAIGDDLRAVDDLRGFLRRADGHPALTASEQRGSRFFTAVLVAGTTLRERRGWLIASWDLDRICADPDIGLLAGKMLAVRPLEGRPGAREIKSLIDEENVRWNVALGRGPNFDQAFPGVNELAIASTGGACALLLALLAGFATRAAGLRAALQAEREVVQMKDHLLHSVSHEFRTPLSVILSSADLLESYPERLTPERRAGALAQIRQSSEQMNDLVGQVLLLNRIEARRMPVQPTRFDVASFARDLTDEIMAAHPSGATIRVTAPDGLAATIDTALLRTVLGNLLTNAVKFSPPDKTVEFTIAGDDGLHFTVTDSGTGIAAEDLKRIREPFFRTASAAEIPGTGLGLAIADQSATLLGGTLTISSSSGGTVATFIIK
jgi:signal transduction histidine kinase